MYKILTGIDRVDASPLSPTMRDTTIRGHNKKIFKQQSKLDLKKTSFSQRAVNDWNSLPRSVFEAESLDQFKAHLDGHWQGERSYNPFSKTHS